MIVRIIDVFVKAEYLEEFTAATVKNHHASMAEIGVLRFDVLKDSGTSGHFVLYEVYASDAAAAKHKETAHYAEWKSTVEKMMAKPRGSVACAPVAPLDSGAW